MSTSSGGVENVVVFVSDALRWDFLPDSIRERGECVKTVSSSTLSPTSFTSMFTGLYPSNHGVNTFADTIRYDDTIHALEGFDFASRPDFEEDPYFDLLHDGVARSKDGLLAELEPPFVHLERDLSTHAPYRTDPDADNWSDENALDYLNRESADIGGLRSRYERSAETSAERFARRIDYLRENDLLDSTLVVFTADHGELLGEYCEFSHTYPLVPELVYVPTVFVHPDETPVPTDLLSHVDLLPTITDVLDADVGYRMDGQSAYADDPRERAVCQVTLPANQTARGNISGWGLETQLQRPALNLDSVWDGDGGWVFNESSRFSRISYLAKSLLPSRRKRHAMRQRPRQLGPLFRAATRSTVRYGTPNFSESDARDDLAVLERGEAVGRRGDELREDQRDHLENLGYI